MTGVSLLVFFCGKEEDQKAASGCRREKNHHQCSVYSDGYFVNVMRYSSKESSMSFCPMTTVYLILLGLR